MLSLCQNGVAALPPGGRRALAVRPGFVRSSVRRAFQISGDRRKVFTRGSAPISSTRKAGRWLRSTLKRPSGVNGGGAAWRGFRWFMLLRRQVAPGDGICFITPRGVEQRQRRGRQSHHAQPHGIIPGRRCTPGISTAVSRWRWNAATYAAGHSGQGRGGRRAEEVRITYADCGGDGFGGTGGVKLDRAKNPDANAAALRARAGDEGQRPIFRPEVEVRGTEWFDTRVTGSGTGHEGLPGCRARAGSRHGTPISCQGTRTGNTPQTACSPKNVTNRLWPEAFTGITGSGRSSEGWTPPATAGRRVMHSSCRSP